MKLVDNLKEVFKHRLLIRTLVSRELKARYRGTVLGFFWSFFNPFLLMVVYTVVFGFIIPARDESIGKPLAYAVFLFSGLLPWTWFSSSSNDSANVLMVNGNLIKKIMFPAEVLPIVSVTSNFVHFLFGLPILLVFLILFGKPLTAYIFLFPIVVLVQYVFTLGFSLLISSLTVHFRDIKDILSNLLTFWFFSTPIIYSFGSSVFKDRPEFQRILSFNPMTHIFTAYQDCFFFGRLFHWKRLGITFLVGLILFWIGYAVFDRLRDSFPEEV